MIFTFKNNTTNTDNLRKEIKKFVDNEHIQMSDSQIHLLAIRLHEKSYSHLTDVVASDEERAFEKMFEQIEIDDFGDDIEITDIDDSDEVERDERARARYEEYLEDKAMEDYYERKYGK